MKTLKVRLTGEGSLLLSSGALANPLSERVQKISEISKKRTKTEQDHLYLARLKWEEALYLENGEVVLPATNLYKSFLEGARKIRQGKQFESGAQIVGSAKLTYDGPTIKTNGGKKFPNPELDKFFQPFCHICMGNVGQKKKIMVARPIFNNWSCEVSVMYNPEIIDRETLIACVKNAGLLCGIGTWRSQYGRYKVKVLK